MGKLLYLIFFIFIISCVKQVEQDSSGAIKRNDVQAPSGFVYENTRSVLVDYTPEFENRKLPEGHIVKFYDKEIHLGGRYISMATVGAFGRISTKILLGNHIHSIYVSYQRIGFISGEIKEINSNREVSFFKKINLKVIVDFIFPKAHAQSFTYLSTYDSNGVPDNLVSNANITNDLLESINNSLPEGKPLPDYHPDYIVDDMAANICLEDDAEIWVSFIHEGAGYRNALGFFTFDHTSPPQSILEITDFTIIYPNVSYRGSGGGLYSGNRVKIGDFQSGRSVGFFLIANGWWGGGVSTTGKRTYYSINDFNPESTDLKRRHNVLLKDPDSGLLVLAFEDLFRDGWTDDDFNDAVFAVEVSPGSAIGNIDNLPVTDIEADSDGDGVSDQFDDYPNDPTKCFDNYYPGEGKRGTLAFEDLWPIQGDYDFNDFMTYYNFKYITNNNQEVVEIQMNFYFLASGASFYNGFAVELPVAPDAVASVEGNYIFNDYISLKANGVEDGQSKAVIVVTDNVNGILPRYANVYKDKYRVDPVSVPIVVKLSTPLSLETIGYPPYKPFLIKNRSRAAEIHMSSNTPTSLFGQSSLYGTGDDDSLDGTLFMNTENMPWAMNFPVEIRPILEKENIKDSYHHFRSWAQSGGFQYMDWYMDLPGHKQSEKFID